MLRNSIAHDALRQVVAGTRPVVKIQNERFTGGVQRMSGLTSSPLLSVGVATYALELRDARGGRELVYRERTREAVLFEVPAGSEFRYFDERRKPFEEWKGTGATGRTPVAGLGSDPGPGRQRAIAARLAARPAFGRRGSAEAMRAPRCVSTRRQRGYLLPIVLFSSAAILIFVAAAYSQVMRQVDDIRRLAANGEFAIAKVSAKAELVYRFMTEPTTVFGLGLAPGTALRVDNRPYSLPSAGLYVRVQDAAGLIDANRADLNVWRRLAEFVGVPTDQRDVLADRILDFIDEDDFRRLNGAERGDYVAAQRRAAAQPRGSRVRCRCNRSSGGRRCCPGR